MLDNNRKSTSSSLDGRKWQRQFGRNNKKEHCLTKSHVTQDLVRRSIEDIQQQNLYYSTVTNKERDNCLHIEKSSDQNHLDYSSHTGESPNKGSIVNDDKLLNSRNGPGGQNVLLSSFLTNNYSKKSFAKKVNKKGSQANDYSKSISSISDLQYTKSAPQKYVQSRKMNSMDQGNLDKVY